MAEFGVSEAKTNFSALLDQAEAGEDVVITRHGRPIVRLVPTSRFDAEKVAAAFDALEQMRKTATLGGLSWKELRDEGRK
ncbi:MAG: prevent-host-death protein [Caulobacter sp.]|nr:prevent-host-death protein [Caulobacter sp.]